MSKHLKGVKGELWRYVRKYIPDNREELVQVPQGESRPGRQRRGRRGLLAGAEGGAGRAG